MNKNNANEMGIEQDAESNIASVIDLAMNGIS